MKKILPYNRYVYRFLCAIILTVFALISFHVVWRNYVELNNFTGRLTGKGNLLMTDMIYTALFIAIGVFLNAFQIGVERLSKLIASIVLTAWVSAVIEVLVSIAILGNFRFIFGFIWRYALLALSQSIILTGLAIVMTKVYRRIVPPIKMLLITGKKENTFEKKINLIPYKYHIEKAIDTSYSEEEILVEIEKAAAVIINDLPAQLENHILKKCFELNKRVYFVPKISDILIKSSDTLNVIDTPLYLSRNLGMSWWNRVFKRLFDIIFSSLVLIISSPVLAITAFAIKLEDGGPVFFKQDRITRDGKHFDILKFRSMIVDAEKDGRPHPAGEKDDRITKVGHFIRTTRIDELPQLWNIFVGEMSVVGPRPERWEHVEIYTKQIPEFAFREKVKGGLTGYAQVYGKYNTIALDKLKLDLIYISNYSFILDLQIIFETIKILFQKESTEGFKVEKVKEIQDDFKEKDCK